MKTKHRPPWTRNNGYETLNSILVPERWKNSVRDAESDTTGFLPSDHYPVIAKIKIYLKAEKPKIIVIDVFNIAIPTVL